MGSIYERGYNQRLYHNRAADNTAMGAKEVLCITIFDMIISTVSQRVHYNEVLHNGTVERLIWNELRPYLCAIYSCSTRV